MNKKPLLIFGMLFVCMSLVLGAVTLDNPSAYEEMTRGASYTYEATNSSAYDNCTFSYKHRGDSAYTTIGVNSSFADSSPTYVGVVPNQFGEFTFKVSCVDSGASEDTDTSVEVKVYSYGADETSEVSVDIVVGVLDNIFDFVSLIALIILAGIIIKKYKKIK